MTFLWMVLVGLFVGVIAKMLMPGRDSGGTIVTMLLGIAGSVVAGVLGRSVGWYAEGEPAGFVASIIGAILILIVYRSITPTAGGRGRGSDRMDRAA